MNMRSIAEILGCVESACLKVYKEVGPSDVEVTPYTVIKTNKAGVPGFRFTMTLTVNGVEVEVQVKTK